jgi:hypothetical protein
MIPGSSTVSAYPTCHSVLFQPPPFRNRKYLLNFLKKLLRIELFLGMAEVGDLPFYKNPGPLLILN